METLRNPQPRKPGHRGRRRRRRIHRRQKKRDRLLATKPFAFAPILFPNSGSASQFRATPIPIGSKRDDNYWPSSKKIERGSRFCASCLLHYSATRTPAVSVGQFKLERNFSSPGASRSVSRLISPKMPFSPAGRDARASGSEGTGAGRGRGLRRRQDLDFGRGGSMTIDGNGAPH